MVTAVALKCLQDIKIKCKTKISVIKKRPSVVFVQQQKQIWLRLIHFCQKTNIKSDAKIEYWFSQSPSVQDMEQTWEISSQLCKCGRDWSYCKPAACLALGTSDSHQHSTCTRSVKVRLQRTQPQLEYVHILYVHMNGCWGTGAHCRHTSTRQMIYMLLHMHLQLCLLYVHKGRWCEETLNRSYRLQQTQRHSCCAG